MTKAEAIEWFKLMEEKFENTKYADALDMAIEALEQEPCDDCISKTLALEILNAMANVDKDNIKVYSKVYSQIKDIPSVTQRCEKWIPVTERLPETREIVLITETLWTVRGIDVDWWDGEQWVRNGQYVIAWQPLPEPYEEAEQ